MLWHVSICLRGITVWRHTGRTARRGREGPRPGKGGGCPGGRGGAPRGPARRATRVRGAAPPRVFGMESICWPAMYESSVSVSVCCITEVTPGVRGRWAAADWRPRPASETGSAARHRLAPPPPRAPPGHRSPRGWCESWGGPAAPPRCCTACRSSPDRASSYRCKVHLWHRVLSWWDLSLAYNGDHYLGPGRRRLTTRWGGVTARAAAAQEDWPRPWRLRGWPACEPPAAPDSPGAASSWRRPCRRYTRRWGTRGPCSRGHDTRSPRARGCGQGSPGGRGWSSANGRRGWGQGERPGLGGRCPGGGPWGDQRGSPGRCSWWGWCWPRQSCKVKFI